MYSVDRGKVDGRYSYSGKHIPELIRNNAVKERENRIIGNQRVHIINLNHVARPVEDVVFYAIIVDRDVDKMDSSVCCSSNTDGWEYAFWVKLAKTELEEAKAEAKALAAAQFAQYGMPNAPEEMLENFSKNILDNKEQNQKIYEKLYEQKVVESVRAKVKVTEKAISAEDFAELAKNL